MGVRLNARLGTLDIDDVFFETTPIRECWSLLVDGQNHEPLLRTQYCSNYIFAVSFYGQTRDSTKYSCR